MKNFLFLLLISLSALSCEKYIFGLPYENNPEDNFEALWSEFDHLCGTFRVHGVDWDEAYATYRPQVTAETSQEELYRILVEILSLLDDGHTTLIPIGTDLPNYIGGPTGRIDTSSDFSLDILTDNYLPDYQETDFAIRYGWLEAGIGYLYLYSFADGERAFDKEMEPVMDYFKDAKGLVVDIRNGGGGEDIGGKTVASHFADERRLYQTSSIKNGPGPDDFTTPEEWHINPRGDRPFTQPIVVLTNRFTISARETFLLAMRTLPHVTTLGDTTAGAFSNVLLRELPNGWGYSMSIGEWRDANGVSHEGIGLIPDVLVRNQRADLLQGQDEALERAVKLLR